ncbi:MAG: rhodanese-like domain-containing protein [Myxococcota bacterium]
MESSPEMPETITLLEPSDARALLERENDLVVLDVRTPQEFEGGHLPNAVNIDITAPDFEQRVAELERGPGYVVHCAAGSEGGRSTRALAQMNSLEFGRLYHLEGGYNAWSAADLPTAHEP